MELIETLRNIAVQEAFAQGRSAEEISGETGLSVREVLAREIDLHLVSVSDAAMILKGLPPEPRGDTNPSFLIEDAARSSRGSPARWRAAHAVTDPERKGNFDASLWISLSARYGPRGRIHYRSIGALNLDIDGTDDEGCALARLGAESVTYVRVPVFPREERHVMKLKKTLRRSSYMRKAPSELARRQALLAVTASDERRGHWALEFFERREAVARWRGRPGCTIREVIQAINALPT